MGLISNEVDRSMLKAGDHIYSYRNLHIYSHHGIYVGEDRVIHYTRTEPKMIEFDSNSICSNCGFKLSTHRGVVKTCLDCFLKSHRLFRCEYEVSMLHFVFKRAGTCSTTSCDTPTVVVDRAIQMLEGNLFGNYDLFENNCESFAVFCKTGDTTSPQAFSVRNAAKIAAEALVKHKLERLGHDFNVHHHKD